MAEIIRTTTSKPILVEYLNPLESRMRLTESINPDGSVKTIVECILQRADAKNHNGRYYPRRILERESKKYIQTYIKEQRAFGELDHPDSQVINIKNVCHTIEELWWDGNDLCGRLEILDTPSGNIVRNILKAGKTLGISSRGIGSVAELAEAGAVEVQDDFEIIGWDIVSSPSTHGAFLHRLNESKNVEISVDKYQKVNKVINSILRNE